MRRFNYFILTNSRANQFPCFGSDGSSMFSCESQPEFFKFDVRFGGSLASFFSKNRVCSHSDSITNTRSLVTSLPIFISPFRRCEDSLLSMFIIKSFASFLGFYIVFVKHVFSFFNKSYMRMGTVCQQYFLIGG